MYNLEIALCFVFIIVLFALIYKFGVVPTLSPYGHHTGVHDVGEFVLKDSNVLTLARFDEEAGLTVILSTMNLKSLVLANLDQVLYICSKHRIHLIPSSRIICRDKDGSFWIVDVSDDLLREPTVTLCSYPNNEKGCLLALVSIIPVQAKVIQAV